MGAFVFNLLFAGGIVAMLKRDFWPQMVSLVHAPYSFDWLMTVIGMVFGVLVGYWLAWSFASGVTKWIFGAKPAQG
ncbi:hypothetical protein [Ralstonia insidiosa]|jgi:hypothetical protein|nr:hypothetical protein [Ralstonia insidiosa]MBA9939835.1 hypothetical protein [Ralstonia insidiosa]MBC9968501.1 hypothetical protein [Ralstonia insidiosa]MBX3904678.1 hypothetical protein [Ralstonia insidiosa]